MKDLRNLLIFPSQEISERLAIAHETWTPEKIILCLIVLSPKIYIYMKSG